MRKRKNQIRILLAVEHWSKTLDMDYSTEFTRYKYLCGYRSRKKLKLPDTEIFITHNDWQKYIEQKLEVLNQNELIEFYYFLNGQVRNSSITRGITLSFLIPFLLSFYMPSIINELLNYAEQTATFIDFEAHPEVRLIMLFTYIVALVTIGGTLIIRDIKDDSLKQHYYEDLKYIVKAKLKKENTRR